MQRDAPDRVGLRAIFLVADDGTARRRQLHANLVPPPRLERQLHQRRRLPLFCDAIMRDGVTRFRTFVRHVNLERIRLVEMRIEFSRVARRRALAQTVLHISAGNLTPYSGDYDYYLDKSGAGSAKLGLVAGEQLSDSRPPEAAAAPRAAGSSPVKSKEQKRKEAEERQAISAARKQAQAHLDKIEREIAALEARHKEIVALLEAPETYAQGGDMMKLNRELIDNTEKQKELNEAWEDATADVAAHGGSVVGRRAIHSTTIPSCEINHPRLYMVLTRQLRFWKKIEIQIVSLRQKVGNRSVQTINQPPL